MWSTWTVRIKDIETSIGIDLLSNLPDPIERALEEKGRYTGSSDANFFPLPTSVLVPLLAGTDSGEANNFSSIGQYGIGENRSFNTIIFDPIGKFDPRLTQIDIGQVSTLKQWSDTQDSSIQSSSSEVGINQWAFSQIGKAEIGTDQDGFNQNALRYDGVTEVSSTQVSRFQQSTPQISSTQISSAQIGPIQFSPKEDSTTQIDTRQLGIIQPSRVKIDIGEISLPSRITLQQLLSSHNPNLQNTTVPTWTEFLQSPTPFNLKIEIADLPTGQLAEATITGYNTFGRPNSGTLTLDINGNGVGWFIDTTPEDNSEFTTQLADTAYKATADSAAYGKYDLLTTILHELGHLNGIIRGNSAFDFHVRNINGIPTFVDGNITAQLTPDGSHLNSTLYPYDLMNTSLKTGVRKLPSTLNLAMINAINTGVESWKSGISGTITAPLTAGALIAINNGDFTTPDSWNTAGATNIINGTATLTEQSQKLASLTQAFIIPTGAKTLQFTIKDKHLIPGDTTKTANDAFEVALLDTLTYSWNFGDNTNSITGQNVNHTFVDNGNYNVTLTVTDKDGAVTTQTVVTKVDNVAPTIVSIVKPATINEGQSVAFSGTASDPGILDTLTYSWNFGDTTPAVTGQSVNQIFADNGNYNVVLTVTDKDGGVTTQTVVAKVVT